MTWQCFWMEDTGTAEVGLRCYHSEPGHTGYTCADGYHAALVWLGVRLPRERTTWQTDQGVTIESFPMAERAYPVPADDSRWPATCQQCDYRFAYDDHRQVWAEQVYRRTDTGEERVLHCAHTPPGIPTAEPGAMWDGWWLRDFQRNPDKPDDGITLMVRCPNTDGTPGGQEWSPDRRSSSGGYWTRQGDPRDPSTLTVTPSIAIGEPSKPNYYHSFLTNGVLGNHLG